MTIKEIAELCDVDEDMVSRWSKECKHIKKFEMFTKLGQQNIIRLITGRPK
jgi:hypothetical protein